MAFTLTPLPGSSGVIVTGSGSGSLEEGEAVVAALIAQFRSRPFRAVLFDVRLLEYVPLPEEARRIAATHGAFGAEHGVRLAYLASPGAQYGVARMVQVLAEAHGVQASVFTSYEPAVRWLESDVKAQGA
jgi:hypothetical protein